MKKQEVQINNIHKKHRHIRKEFILFVIVLLLLISAFTVAKIMTTEVNKKSEYSAIKIQESKIKTLKMLTVPNYVSIQIIDIDGTSRCGIKLDGIHNIVIHYVGNPGTTANQNRSYYTNEDSKVSSHFLVGLDGEIIQCIPLDEMSAASNDRNHDTISIEVCHPDNKGKFTEASYNSVVKLSAWLCKQTGLTENDIIRHYDVTGKLCPLYYVKHEDAWEKLKADVGTAISIDEN